MNATIEKFGYPATLIRDYEHWVVLLRPQQATLGALVLAAKDPVEAFGELSPLAMAELALIVPAIEHVMTDAFGYDKINYLMLMMVDPHVHFHVLPRYAATREFEQAEFDDPGWPGPPRLDHHTELDDTQFAALLGHLTRAWLRAV
ncbi:MAG: HIT family protein [Gammaproteobacteria bacterium]